MLYPASPNGAGITRKEIMVVDEGRQHDLEELMELHRTAKNSFKRDNVEKIIEKIMRESGEIREERESLIQAIRAGDRRRVRYVQERIRKIRYDETGGKDL
jgi:hypothetical protein